MSEDVSPILDRHTQERLGDKLREELDCLARQEPSKEIETLLASLRETGESRRDRSPDRG
jgi:hypothetical protein